MNNYKPHYRRVLKQVLLVPIIASWIAPSLFCIAFVGREPDIVIIFLISWAIGLGIGLPHTIVVGSLLGRFYRKQFLQENAPQLFSRLFFVYQLTYWIPGGLVIAEDNHFGILGAVVLAGWIQATAVLWLVCRGYTKERDKSMALLTDRIEGIR